MDLYQELQKADDGKHKPFVPKGRPLGAHQVCATCSTGPTYTPAAYCADARKRKEYKK
jgi:hypothetical protein